MGKTNFYFEYFINGCHTFDAVSKIYRSTHRISADCDCHGVYTAACGQFFTDGISPDKIYESVMTYNQSNRLKQELTYREGDSAQSVMEAYEKETVKTVEEYVLENGYYPAKTTVTVEKDKDSKDYGKICSVSVVLSEKKEQQISVEQIVIGESTEEKKQEISQDYSTLRMNWHSFYILQFHVWR